MKNDLELFVETVNTIAVLNCLDLEFILFPLYVSGKEFEICNTWYGKSESLTI